MKKIAFPLTHPAAGGGTIRVICPGTPLASTELSLGNNKALQMRGTGPTVEQHLRDIAETRKGTA